MALLADEELSNPDWASTWGPQLQVGFETREDRPWCREGGARSWLRRAPADELRLFVDPSGTILMANKEAAKWLGYTRRMVGRCVYDLLPPRSARLWNQQLSAVANTGVATSFADRNQARSLRVTMRAIVESTNRLTAAAVLVLVRAADHQASANELADLLEATTPLVGASTSDEVRTLVVDGMLSLAGGDAVVFVASREPGAALAQHPVIRCSVGARELFDELLEPDPLALREVLAEVFEHTTSSKPVVHLSLRPAATRAGAAGEEIGHAIKALIARVDVCAIALRHGEEVLGHAALLMRNGGDSPNLAPLTALAKSAAAALARCRAADRQRSAQEAQRREEIMEALREQAAAVSRKLEHLLSIIGGHAHEMAENHAELSAASFDVIQETTEQAAHIVSQLLTFSGEQQQRRDAVDLNHNIERILSALRSVLGERIHLVPALASNLWPVAGDRAELGKVLIELVLNAREAMARGVLTVATANVEIGADNADGADAHPVLAPGRYVRLTVSDTGCGMDEATRERALHPYFTTKEPGAGMGLATAHGVARQCGGHVNIDSQPGVGTSVTLYLPSAITQPRRGEEAPPQESAGTRNRETTRRLELPAGEVNR